MPDPAIEAHKAGLDYTQPTGKGIKKAKVSYEWVSDPSNPLAPPRQRRVIEAGNGGSGGIFSKWFGGGEKITPIPMQATPLQPQPQNQHGYDWLGRPKPPPPQPRSLPQITPHGQPQWTQPPMLLEPSPLPPNIDTMPWGDRRYWYKVRDEQMRAIKLMQRAAKDAQKAQMKELKIKQKAQEKERIRELKATEKQLKYLRKHPQRNLPMPTYPMNTAPPAMAQPQGQQPLSFMMPTGEEFGVRRPFNAPGVPVSLGGPPGHAGWPMMSRTMTHAVRDLTREERVHAIQSGRVWGPTW